jgi:hypothetical protein
MEDLVATERPDQAWWESRIMDEHPSGLVLRLQRVLDAPPERIFMMLPENRPRRSRAVGGSISTPCTKDPLGDLRPAGWSEPRARTAAGQRGLTGGNRR